MSNKLNILYAEDDRVSNEALTFLLNKMSMVESVDSFYDGYDALEKFKQNNNYDVIISDIKMPKLNGTELINEAKKIKNDIDTILLTAFNDVEYLHKAIDLSVNKYLVKPLDALLLKEQLEKFHDKKIVRIRVQEDEKNKEISTRKKAIDEAIYNISHQWRQPLNLIALEVSHLQISKSSNKFEGKDVDETLDNILKAANKLSNTITHFENIENVDDYTKAEVVNLKSLLIAELDLFESLFNKYDISVSLNIEETLTCIIYKKEFLSVIKDIILNSIEQFTHAKIQNAKIEISAFKDDKNLILEIKDNGGGIDNEALPKIFEPYFTTKFASEDKGLGLYLSQKIISGKFKGSIKASNENGGATFKIEIPNI